MASAETSLRVAIRVRPLKESEGACAWRLEEDGSVFLADTGGEAPVPGRTAFRYDAVYGEHVDTRTVYEGACRDLVDGALHGVNGTIFAYGQTSSGKTYTMQGGDKYGASAPGVMHLAAEQIFANIEERSDTDFLLRCSYLEVYNEQLRDLLAADGTGDVRIREDPRTGVYIEGAQEEVVVDASSIAEALVRGERARAVGATAMNERSSRSHTVFRIVVESKVRDDEASGVLVGALSLVDLAGSESVRLTGASGLRAKEGGKINTSLLTLSRVIKQLGEGQRSGGEAFVNFRDSKLTRLLQPTLGGSARLAMVCCVAPAEGYVEETRSTLQFGDRASQVKLAPVVHEILDDASQLRRVKRQLAELLAKQREYDELGASGKTEELAKLLDANAQLGAAVEAKEADLAAQVESVERLKKMIVLGGSRPAAAAPAKRRAGPRRKRARETWAPGARFDDDDDDDDGGAPGGLGAIGEDDGDCAAPSPLVVPDRRLTLGAAVRDRLPPMAAPTPPRAAPRRDSLSPGRAAAALHEAKAEAATEAAALRRAAGDADARADAAEGALAALGADVARECGAFDDDAARRGLPALDAVDGAAAPGAVAAAVRARRDRCVAAADAVAGELKAAQRDAFVLKQEVVELREVSASFDGRVAEIDDELAARDAELAAARDDADAARGALADAEAAGAAAVEAAEGRAAAAEAARAEAAAARDADAAAARERAAEDAADLQRVIADVEARAGAADARAEAQRGAIAGLEARAADAEAARDAAAARAADAEGALAAAATSADARAADDAAALAELAAAAAAAEAGAAAARDARDAAERRAAAAEDAAAAGDGDARAALEGLRSELAAAEAARDAAAAAGEDAAAALRSDVATLELEKDAAVAGAAAAAEEHGAALRGLEAAAARAAEDLAAAAARAAALERERDGLAAAAAEAAAAGGAAPADEAAALAAARDAAEAARLSAEADLAAARGELAGRDARIERLEQVKMTTEIFKKIQAMQVDKARAEGEVAELRSQLRCLEDRLADRPAPAGAASPLRDAADALARGAAAPASVAAKLQLDELAARNAELAAELAAARADAAAAAAESRGAAAALAPLAGLDASSADVGAAAARVAELAEASRAELARSRAEAAAAVEARGAAEAKAKDLAARAERAERGVKALQTPAGRRAAQNAAALQEKVEFLEKENLELMLEVKAVQQLALKHKADADALRRGEHAPSPAPPRSAAKARRGSAAPASSAKIRLDVDKENLVKATNDAEAYASAKKAPFAALDAAPVAAAAGDEQPPECAQS